MKSSEKLLSAFLVCLAGLACDNDTLVGIVVVADAGADGPVAVPPVPDAAVPPPVSLGPIGKFCGSRGNGRVDHIVVAAAAPIMAVAYSSGMITLYDAVTGAEKRVLPGHAGAVGRMAISMDGRLLASVRGADLVVWNTESGEVVRRLVAPGQLSMGLAFSPGGTELLDADNIGIVVLWSLSDGRQLWRTTYPESIGDAHYLPDGSGVVVRLAKESVRDLNVLTLNATDGTTRHAVALFWVQIKAISPDSKYAVGDAIGIAGSWNLETGAPKWQPHGSLPKGGVVAVDPKGEMLVVSRYERAPGPPNDHLAFLSATTGELIQAAPTAFERTTVAFLPGQRRVAIGDASGQVFFMDLTSETPITTIKSPLGEQYIVSSISTSADGSRWATMPAVLPGSVTIWDRIGPARSIALVPMPGPTSTASFLASVGDRGVSLSPDGTRVAVVSSWDPGIGHLFAADDGKLLAMFGDHLTSISFSPDGQQILTTRNGRGFDLWSKNGDPILGFATSSTMGVIGAHFSPDGKHLALIVAGAEQNQGAVAMMDLEKHTILWRAGPHREGALAAKRGVLSFSPDGKWIAFKDTWSGGTGEVTVFDAADGAVVRNLSRPGGNDLDYVYDDRTMVGRSYSGGSVQFSADGKLLAVAAGHGVLIWRTSDWSPYDPIPGAASSLTFLPGSNDLVTGGLDGAIRTWCDVTANAE